MRAFLELAGGLIAGGAILILWGKARGERALTEVWRGELAARVAEVTTWKQRAYGYWSVICRHDLTAEANAAAVYLGALPADVSRETSEPECGAMLDDVCVCRERGSHHPHVCSACLRRWTITGGVLVSAPPPTLGDALLHPTTPPLVIDGGDDDGPVYDEPEHFTRGPEPGTPEWS